MGKIIEKLTVKIPQKRRHKTDQDANKDAINRLKLSYGTIPSFTSYFRSS